MYSSLIKYMIMKRQAAWRNPSWERSVPNGTSAICRHLVMHHQPAVRSDRNNILNEAATTVQEAVTSYCARSAAGPGTEMVQNPLGIYPARPRLCEWSVRGQKFDLFHPLLAIR